MSRHMFDLAPLVIGSSPRYFGLAGSVPSKDEVPSTRPTIANSRCVTLSVQPQISLSSTPRLAPIALLGRKETRSASRHSNPPAFPLWHLASAPVIARRPPALVSTAVAAWRHSPPRSR